MVDLARKEYNRRYYQANKERAKAYYQANKDKQRQQATQWIATNPIRYRDSQYRKKFGITYDEVQAMREQQGNRCIICGKEFDVSSRHTTYCVDHCHTEGHVRGLLCGACNKGLGLFKDDPQILANAIKYLCGD